MANKKNGLGRGLEALLPQSQTSNQDGIQEIKVELIEPNRYQPRKEFSKESLKELAESIKSYGILQPLIIRTLENDRYELISGERRLRAAKIAGLEKVPAIVREYSDSQTSEISIIENVQREDLNVIEEALAYERLIKEFGHTQEIIASKIGRSRSHISNMLRLLKLTPTVKALIEKGFLTLGQARPLLAIEDESLQVQVAEMILSEGLSVRKVEAFINEVKNSVLPKSEVKPKVKEEQKINFDSEKTEVENEIKIETEVETETETKIEVENKNETEVENVIKNEGENTTTVESEFKIEEKNVKSPRQKNEPSIFVREAEDQLTEILGAKVKITLNNNFGRIQIDFADEQDLSRILEEIHKMKLLKPKNLSSATKEEKIEALRKFSTSNNFAI